MAVLTRAAGYSNLNAAQYIPVLFEAEMLNEFYANMVYRDIANTKLESKLKKFGDTVRVRILPTPIIRNGVIGEDPTIDTPQGSYIDLEINKFKYWAFGVDTADIKMSDLGFIGEESAHHAKYLNIEVDKDVLQNTYLSAHAKNQGNSAGVDSGDIGLGVAGTPVQLTTSNMVEVLVERVNVVMGEQNVPPPYWLILPPWAIGKYLNSDLKNAALTGDPRSPLRTSRVDVVNNVQLFTSNNLKTVIDTVKCWHCPFGHKSAITFAAPIIEVKPAEKGWMEIFKARILYGYKVMKSEALGDLYIRKPA